MTDYITQAAITLAVFRGNFLKENHNIPILNNMISEYIRDGYRGGKVEVYKPVLENGYLYDVNSQYPNAMKNPMPVGNPIYIFKPVLDDFFGFARANVKAPPNLKKPFLSYKTPDNRIIYPLGV